ncbi:MAG: ABC transporter permease [Caldilineae bacterium]|nr:MAG: ABC transporter permease [Caldilineae bacterium]
MTTETTSLDQLSDEFQAFTGKPRSPMSDAIREFRRNKVAVGSMIFVGIVFIVAIFAPVFAPYHFALQNTSFARAKILEPYIITTDRYEECHWKGTPLDFGCTVFIAGSDALGRDLWSRVVYGTRVSLAVALVASSVSLLIGLAYGTLSGYFGGRVDEIMMRIVDFLYAVPVLVLIILMQVYFKALTRQGAEGFAGLLIRWNQAMGGMLFLFIAMGALNWIGMARLARGQVLSQKKKEYIEAAKSIGSSDTRIIFKHLIPNIIGPLVVIETLAIPGYIFTEAALSFIGLGVDPPTPSWGAMISESTQGIRSNPHLVLIPGAALTLLTLAFNFMGDGLRDAIDPRSHNR